MTDFEPITIIFTSSRIGTVTYLTDGVHSTLRGSVRTGYGRRDHQAVGASSAAHPSCNPWCRQDCMLHLDLHGVKRLNISGVTYCSQTDDFEGYELD